MCGRPVQGASQDSRLALPRRHLRPPDPDFGHPRESLASALRTHLTPLFPSHPLGRTPPISGVQGPQEGTSRLDFEERAAYHRARYGGGDSADSRAAAQGLAPAPSGRPEPSGSASAPGAGAATHRLSTRIRAHFETTAWGTRFGRTKSSNSLCFRPKRWPIRSGPPTLARPCSCRTSEGPP